MLNSENSANQESSAELRKRYTVQILFLSALLVISILAILESLTFSAAGKAFPLFIAAALAVATLGNIMQELRNRAKSEAPDPGVAPQATWIQGFIWIGIVALYPVLISILGFYVATVLWLGSLLRLQAKMPWKLMTISIIAYMIIWTGLTYFLGMSVPQGLVFNFI